MAVGSLAAHPRAGRSSSGADDQVILHFLRRPASERLEEHLVEVNAMEFLCARAFFSGRKLAAHLGLR